MQLDVGVERPNPISVPIEVQAALDWVALLAGCRSGRLSGRMIGDPVLVDALRHYASTDLPPFPPPLTGPAPVVPCRGAIHRAHFSPSVRTNSVPIALDARRLIALGADPGDLSALVTDDQPDEVITLTEGRLAAPLRPLRAGPLRLAADLPLARWQRLGYRRVTSQGVQGLAALAWAALDRLMTRRGRPDLADRCRIAMLRTLCAGGPVRSLGTVAVRTYRRAA